MSGSTWPWSRRRTAPPPVASTPVPAPAPAVAPDPPSAPPAAAAAAPEDWAAAQALAWAARTDLSSADYAAGLEHLNALKHDFVVFDVDGGDVRVREKHVHHPLAFNRRIEHFRTSLYRDHLREAAARAGLARPVALGMVVSDLANDIDPRLPAFTYQRRRDEPWLLLPDPEMLEFDFYDEEAPDPLASADKVNRIVFSGASTGRPLDLEAVRADASERLSYAARFVGHPLVEFGIGLASECDTAETRAALEAKPYFHRLEWPEQMRRRYVLSLDGNGATCSRVLRTLRSHSCLVKGASEHLLFYFPGLLPWRHFVPVADAAELERLAPRLVREDFPSETITHAANAFCRTHLSRDAVVRYTAALLRGFSEAYLQRL